MTEQTDNTPTQQENALYDLVKVGDILAIWDLRTESEDLEQFDLDHQRAFSRYQTENEMPEEQREELTADVVEKENQEAPTEEV